MNDYIAWMNHADRAPDGPVVGGHPACWIRTFRPKARPDQPLCGAENRWSPGSGCSRGSNGGGVYSQWTDIAMVFAVILAPGCAALPAWIAAPSEGASSAATHIWAFFP